MYFGIKSLINFYFKVKQKIVLLLSAKFCLVCR
jgi:hypothetical protein